jgi:amidase
MTTARGLTSEPWELSAVELARRIRLGRLTAVEALEAHLERIGTLNPTLNAVVSLDEGRARGQAKAADIAFARGDSLGPLHGVPMTLKDAHDVAGLRTTVGLPIFDRVAVEDGSVAARLRASGANIIGHSNVAAGLGDFLQSANPIFGRTGNPWDPARNPGGSSGGAAAAVAAGMTPVEVGSDMVGSIRLPAHYCGVYGLKTTEHRVPLTGFFRQPEGVSRSVRIISALGPIARDLDDVELLLRIISGPDGRDSDVPPVSLRQRNRRELAGLRLAVAPTWPGVSVSSRGRQLVERVAAQAADAGAYVEDGLPEVDWDALHQLYGELMTVITGGPSTIAEDQRSAAWYLDALARRDQFISAWETYFQDVDALVLPAGISGSFTDEAPGQTENWRLHGFASLTGLPALVAPGGMDEDRMPIGVQVVGPLWSEIRLLEITRELERAGILPGFQAPPDDSESQRPRNLALPRSSQG